MRDCQIFFVHGIDNQGDTARNIDKAWFLALQDGWAGAECTVDVPRLGTGAAYYGDKLAEASNRWDRNKLTIIDQGGNDVSEDEDVATLYREYGQVLYDEHKIDSAPDPQLEAEAIEMGFPHTKSTKRAARIIEALDPEKGSFLVEKFLPQAAVYIQRPGLAKAIDDMVEAQLREFMEPDKKLIVISHSLGTVVSYRVLRRAKDLPPLDIEFVTVGSPLGSIAMQKILPVPRIKPVCVRNWVNAADSRDFVAIRHILDEDTFGKAQITNLKGVKNGEDNRHSIGGYLRTKLLAKAIFDILL
jgi:hypothetical protein